jgi:hypothetical protein
VPIAVGALLALGVGLLMTVLGFDRDRSFYPTVTIVIAFIYVLFAVMGASTSALLLESAVGVGFLVMAVVGFKSSLWLVALALAAHGVFDAVHGRIITNPGVPAFWPGFCAAYDVTAGAYLAWLLKTQRVRAR